MLFKINVDLLIEVSNKTQLTEYIKKKFDKCVQKKVLIEEYKRTSKEKIDVNLKYTIRRFSDLDEQTKEDILKDFNTCDYTILSLSKKYHLASATISKIIDEGLLHNSILYKRKSEDNIKKLLNK